MGNKLFIVCGAAGSGKSTLARLVVDDFPNRIELYKKYTTRKARENDDCRSIAKIEIGDFDLAYEAMGNKYGISVSEILAILESGKDVILPTTDFRATERLKYFFQDQCTALCVVTTVDTNKFDQIHKDRYGFEPSNKQRLRMTKHFSRMFSATKLDDWHAVYEHSTKISELVSASIPDSEGLEIRKTKIRNFQTRLFEKPSIFDHLILNYREGYPSDMLTQFQCVITEAKQKEQKKEAPILFVISSASGHGKGKLAEALRIIAPKEILVVEKEAKRDPKKNDKADGLIPIGEDGEFSKDFTFTFFSHRTEDYEGTEYAFDIEKVKTNLKNNKSQILVANSLANSELYERLRTEFHDTMIHIYLLRLQTEQELKDYQYENCDTKREAKARIKQTKDLYQSYVKNLNTVDFVLLNTSFYEDLHNQVFNLLTHHGIYSLSQANSK